MALQSYTDVNGMLRTPDDPGYWSNMRPQEIAAIAQAGGADAAGATRALTDRYFGEGMVDYATGYGIGGPGYDIAQNSFYSGATTDYSPAQMKEIAKQNEFGLQSLANTKINSQAYNPNSASNSTWENQLRQALGSRLMPNQQVSGGQMVSAPSAFFGSGAQLSPQQTAALAQQRNQAMQAHGLGGFGGGYAQQQPQQRRLNMPMRGNPFASRQRGLSRGIGQRQMMLANMLRRR